MNKTAFFILLASILAIQISCTRSYKDDLVTDFPGYGEHSYDIYSGMLKVTESGSRQIHYTLIESDNNPSTDPLVIWLNGGPGCSSLLGLIQENGPFLFEGINPFLTANPDFTWNKNANVLYLEGPPGVGFSINNDPDYKYTEDNTGSDFLQALIQFRSRFETVLNFENPLWLSGESYAGMYVPFFSKHILAYNEENDQKFNLKGFLIGNGIFIMSEKLLNKHMTQTYVNNNFVNGELRDIFYNDCEKHPYSLKCLKFQQTYSNIMNNTDPYQIYNYTYSYSSNNNVLEKLYELKVENIPEQNGGDDIVTNALKNIHRTKIFNSNETPTPDGIINAYFNLPEVKKALHVESFKGQWEECSSIVGNKYIRGADSTHLYPSFFEAGLQIMIYSGNTDAIVPHSYTTECIEDLMTNPKYGSDFTKKGKWRQWKADGSKQVGGMVQYYSTQTGSEFVYTMVRAAGHEVPEYQKQSAYHMFNNFINGKSL